MGVFVAEGAYEGDLIEEFLSAHTFSTGQRLDDGRRHVSSLLRVYQSGGSLTELIHLANFGGAHGVMFGHDGQPDDRLDLRTASPSVINLATDPDGNASPAH